MQVICLNEEAFFALLDEVVQHVKEKHNSKSDRWISSDEVMQKLRITSKTTLQKWRDEGKIRFSQPEKKIILYDVESIEEFLNKNAKNTF